MIGVIPKIDFFAIILMGRRELVDLLCLPGVSWLLCGSSRWCHGFVCSLWLWYILIILAILLVLEDGIYMLWYMGPLVCCLLIVFKIYFFKNCFRNTIRVSISLHRDHDRRFVGPDICPNCLQRLLADNTRVDRFIALGMLYLWTI